MWATMKQAGESLFACCAVALHSAIGSYLQAGGITGHLGSREYARKLEAPNLRAHLSVSDSGASTATCLCLVRSLHKCNSCKVCYCRLSVLDIVASTATCFCLVHFLIHDHRRLKAV